MKENTSAFNSWIKDAQKGDGLAQIFIGVFYLYGRGVPKDYNEASKWFHKSAKQGNSVAQCYLGLMYRKSFTLKQDDAPVKSDGPKAYTDFIPLTKLQVLYRDEESFQKDDIKAIQWLLKSAEQGNSLAQYHLGEMYLRGEGVPRNDVEAVKWFLMSAKKGHANAQFNLGLMYEEGTGVPQDKKQAKYWYQMSAKQSHEKAQSKLSIIT